MVFMIYAFGVIAGLLVLLGCVMLEARDVKEGGLCLLIALVLGININLTHDVVAENGQLTAKYSAALVKIEKGNERVIDLITDNSKLLMEAKVANDSLTRIRHNYSVLEQQAKVDKKNLEEAQAKLAKIKVLVNKEK